MPDLYDDEDELARLLDKADAGMPAPPVELDPEELKSLLEDEASARSAPSMEIGDIQMGDGSLGENAALEGWRPAGEESGMDDGLSALLDDATRPAAVPAPKDAAGVAMADDNGRQAPFGVKDQRQDLAGNASRVAELYRGLEAEQAGPGRRERELGQSWPGSDDEIRSAMRTSAILKALLGDDAGYGKRAEYLIGREKEHSARLSAARAADAADAEKDRRVDQATAEMLVLAGVSPEAAVMARMGDPIVQLVRSTGGLGVKLRNQDTQALNKNVGETGDVWQTLTEEDGKNARQEKQLANNVEVAGLRKRGAKGGGAGGAGGSDPSLLSAFLQRNENVPPAIADAFVAGTLDDTDPNFARLHSARTIFNGMGGDKQAQLLRGTLGREGGDEDAAAKSARIKQADPAQRTKIKRELASYNTALSAAIRGWNSLPANVKQLVAKTGLEGATAQLRQAGMTPEEQAKFSPIIALINDNIKKTAGAAVSNSEWARKSAEIGLSGALSPFNSPSVLTGWLKRAGDAYKADVAAIESEYPGLFGGAQ